MDYGTKKQLLTAADRRQQADLLLPRAGGLLQIALVLVGHVIGAADRLGNIPVLQIRADRVAGAERFACTVREDTDHAGGAVGAGRVGGAGIH